MSNLEIIDIVDPGTFEKEFVWLKAKLDLDLGHYTITDNTYDSGKASNKWRHTYSFPEKKIKKDEWIQLWTKSGKNTESESTLNTQKVKIHQFFMNLSVPVWNQEGDVARLFYQIHTFTKKK